MSTRVENVGALLHKFPPAHRVATHARELLGLARRQSQIRKYLASTPNFAGLQIGAGPHHLDGWLKTDIAPMDLQTVFVDARKRLPFESETFDYIVAEHVIEHLEYKEAIVMLAEFHRVLKPDGVVRISTPDLLLTLQLMSEPLMPVLERYVSWSNSTYDPDCDPHSATHVVNRLQHEWGHKFLYDAETLIAALHQCGFAEVNRRAPGESSHRAMSHVDFHADEVSREFSDIESLIIEAMK